MADNILTKEIAGQPVGVWGIVILGGLGIAYYFSKNQAEADAEGEREPLVTPGVGTGLIPAGAGFRPQPEQEEEEGFETNVAWGNAAKNWLIGQGTNPTLADNAVRKYLVAEQLTIEENALIALVLAASGLGVPPEDLPPAPPPETEPEEPEEPEAPGVPRLRARPQHTTGRVGQRGVHITGRVTVDGEAPDSPQLVRWTVYTPNGRKVGTSATSTDSDGNFDIVLGTFGHAGLWRYVVSWRGLSTDIGIRVSR